jgi:murein L,D-transpeptidase YafK
MAAVQRHPLKLAFFFICLMLVPIVHLPPADAMGKKPGSLTHTIQNFGPEARLVKVLFEISNDHLDAALREVESLLKVYPNFRLAHLIHGDLLMAHAAPLETLGDVAGAPKDKIEDLREEALARLKRYVGQSHQNQVPDNLVQFDPQQTNAIVVDASKSRLYLFANDNGKPKYVGDYYITVGKNGADKTKEGDQRTPLGVYFITSSLPKDKIGAFYGIGAFPLNYPNEWDRREGRNGHGIWLHGVPSDTYSRPPRASNGCVVLTNQDLKQISHSLQIGLTSVIINDNINWVDESAVEKEKASLDKALESWRKDWESLNTERYLSHYSREFSSGGQNYRDWAQQKRQVNAGKSSLKIDISRVSMFRYPGKDNMVVVTFEQDYHSNNLNNRMRKRQYWHMENGQWRIVYEGAA